MGGLMSNHLILLSLPTTYNNLNVGQETETERFNLFEVRWEISTGCLLLIRETDIETMGGRGKCPEQFV